MVEEEKKEETIYNVVEVPNNFVQVIEYPDKKKYSFDAAILDLLERVHKLEKKIG
jgi:hypothetical protein